MKTTYKFKPDTPYSLHDMRISKIECIENTIKLSFENGFVSTKEPYPQVDGYILIEDVDYDFCFAYLLSKDGECCAFQAQKLEFKDFLKQYPQFTFEVVDENYGYNSVNYNGYLILSNIDHFIEFTLTIYHFGDIVYVTKEEEERHA